MDKEKVLDKVRKLLALGNNAGATEAERERALAQANKFLLKYNLEMPVNGTQVDPLAGYGMVEVKLYQSPPTRVIGKAVSELYFCSYLIYKGSDKHVIIGTEINRETAALIFTLVTKGIMRETGKRKMPAGIRTSFFYGAAQTIKERCAELRAANERMSAPGTALVLYDRHKELNRKFIEKTFSVKTTSGRNPKHLDYDAYQQGQQYARGLDLTRNLK